MPKPLGIMAMTALVGLLTLFVNNAMALTANATPYSIGFVDATNNMPDTIHGSTLSSPVTLPTNVPTKDGYTFIGWCSARTTDDTCSGTTYQPGGTYTLSNGAMTNLYAMWREPLYMQDVGTWGSTLSTGDSIEAIDSRDGKSYWVTKLSDGNIWMTQNLDLNLSTATTLTSNDTDLTKYDETTYTNTYASTGGYSKDATTGVISWTPSKSTIDATSGDSAANDAIKSGWTDDNNVINSADVGLWYQKGTWYSSSICNYLTTTCDNFQKDTPDSVNGTHGAIGNYYDYAAAIAANAIPSKWRADDVEPGNSICPKGWRLPSKVSGDFSTLNTNYNSGSTDTGLFGAPLYLPRAGDVNASGLGAAGIYGNYWTGTVSRMNGAYYLYFASSNVDPANSDSWYYGRTVRCIAR